MAIVLGVFTVAALVVIFTSCQDIPEALLDDIHCPVGSGVNRKTVLIDTLATCRCVVSNHGNPPAQARWYTQYNETVGAENTTDSSSVLTFSYNSSNPDESFVCRPYTPVATAVKAVTYTPVFRCTYDIMDKEFVTSFACPVPANVQNFTWQLLSLGSQEINVSYCSFVTDDCKDVWSDIFAGDLISQNNKLHALLTVIHPSINLTLFSYLTDTGVRSCISELELFAQPNFIRCTQTYTATYADYTCTLDNVYPAVIANLTRDEEPFKPTDFDDSNTNCTYGAYGSGQYGDYNGSCTWRIKMKSMSLVNNITVSFSAVVSNPSKVHFSPTTDTYTIRFSVPAVELVLYECPGVIGETIKKGTTATCKCQVNNADHSPAFAQWYTKDNKTVGVADHTKKFSILTLNYIPSDPTPTYYCSPITDLPVNVLPIPYNPKFSSSQRPTIVTGLLALIIIVGALLSGAFSC